MSSSGTPRGRCTSNRRCGRTRALAGGGEFWRPGGSQRWAPGDEGIVVSPRDGDLALFLELADDPDDAGLPFLDHVHPNLAEHVDLLRERERCSLGHVLHDLGAYLLADALERGGQF